MRADSSRQSFLGRDSERTLKTTRAGIAGLGGGGSHVCQQLAHVGVGNYALADEQTIEDTNLNRLVGATAADVAAARLKTEIAKRVILGIRPDAKVSAEPKAWQEQASRFRRMDVIFGCVDSFSERDQLERFARRYLIPYIDIGMDVYRHGDRFHVSGQIAVSLPGRACLRCMGVLREDLLAEEASRYGAAGARQQVVWTNGVLASSAVGEFMKLVTPWSPKAPVPLLEYDADIGTVVASSKLPYLPPACRHFRGRDDLGDPFWSIEQQHAPVGAS